MTDATLGAAPATHRHTHSHGALAPLTVVRRVAWCVLGLQLAGFLVWSTLQYRRFALTVDFTEYQQAWYLIAHGHLNPVATVGRGYFWQNHSEIIMWPLALLYWLWPHQVTLLWIQDICVAAAEAVAVSWICELAERHAAGRRSVALAAFGIALIMINPWIWYSISFDFHAESIAILFTCLLARDLANGRRRTWVWVALLLSCGDVAGSYIIGFGAAAILAGRGQRRLGVALACTGVGAVGLITVVHGNLGSPLTGYASLVGIKASVTNPPGLLTLAKAAARHPAALLKPLWAKRADFWANVGSAGIVGLAFVWILPLLVLLLVVNMLVPGVLFAMPSYQDLPIYLLGPAGTVAIIGLLLRHHRRVGLLIATIALVQAAGMAAVWLPQLPVRWLRVPAAAASTLAAIENEIPASAEVVASEGISGRFSSRVDIQVIESPTVLPVSNPTWFVVAPEAGQEMQSTASSMALIAELAGPLHATLVTHANGIWAFRWQPPPGVTTITVPSNYAPLQAWTSPAAASADMLTGPPSSWHLASTGARGYVADQLEWREQPGHYTAQVSLSASGPVNVEVWNDTCDTLLVRHSIPDTSGLQTISLPVAATKACPTPLYSGWGPFRAYFLPPPAGQRLEIRVWSPGGETVDVYRASLTAAAHAPAG